MATCPQVQTPETVSRAWEAIAGIPCAVCGQSSITAPSGATPSTRFTCRECCPRPTPTEPPEGEAAEVGCGERTTEPSEPGGLDDAGLGAWGTQSAAAEALMLYAMLGRNGYTAESIRDLIRLFSLRP
jgi:hypothetical protein